MPDGTWACFPRAAGVDARTLGGACGGAPQPWGVEFCKRSDPEGYRSIGRSTRCECEAGGADASS
jgi:hypothetical protein